MAKSGVRHSYILIFILFNCWSCSHIANIMLPQEMKTARELFLQKNYSDAAEAFSRIQNQAQQDSLRQKALLGQACSRMLLADSEIQSQEALQLWQTWCEGQANTFHLEDFCIFLTPVMEKWSNPQKKRSVRKTQKRKSLSQRLNFREESDLAKEFANQEKELRKLRSQIKEREQNIKELNTKLKALEDINQEIDQKKKGMDLQ